MKEYDLLVLGGGSAGLNLAHPVAAAGWKTAVVEASHLGGTCINIGCIPSKTLISSARVMQTFREAKQFGIAAGPPQPDWTEIVGRKDRLVDKIRNRSYKNVKNSANLDLYEGEAAFTGPRTVTVNGETLVSEKVVIATGARPAIPPVPGLEAIEYLTSTTAMELPALPAGMLILGGGIIALEFSQLFCRLGVEVTVLQRDRRLAPNLEPELAEEIRGVLEGEGVTVRTGAKITEIGADSGGVFALDEGDDGARRHQAEQILVAAGRMPNSDRLDLGRAGVQTDRRGYVVVDDQFRTSADGVWAIGDAAGGMMFTHRAWHDAVLLSRYFLEERPVTTAERLIPFAIFTEPEIAGVGLGEAAASQEGYRIRVQRFPFSFQGRARAIGKLTGFVKLVVDEDSDRILGAHLIGPEAGELIHELIAAMRFKATVYDIQDMIHVHPTLSEAINNSAWSR